MQQNLEEITLVGSSKKAEGPPTEEEAKAENDRFEAMWGVSLWATQSVDMIGS